MTNFVDFARQLADEIAELYARHEDLEGRVERMFRKGTVTDVDAQNQLYRQVIGLDEDGNPVKSPWVPYAQFAGDRRIHTPPTVGQQMLMISPDGDHEQAHGIPLTFSNQNPSPSQDPDSHVDAWGNVTHTLTKDGFTMKYGQVTFSFTASGLDVQGGHIKHNGKSIDATHIHGGVTPGGGNTDVPSN